MGFYEEFIDHYDQLVSFEERKEREIGFYRRIFNKHNVEKVLDCACGTGHHAIMFKEIGRDVQGSDKSAAMIDKARENAKERKIDAKFNVADFRQLTDSYSEKFDAVLCVGNSLPHLQQEKDLIHALKEMRQLLRDKGVLILEQRNYDLLLEERKRFFPFRIEDRHTFFYVLDYKQEVITFNVIHIDNEQEDYDVFSTEYNSLKKNKLESLLRQSGFDNLQFFGNYDGKDLNLEEDGRYVVVAETID